MQNFQTLYEFIDRALKNRKYAPNTALGLKAALKLFEAEIHDEERDSVQKFKDNLEEIYHAVASKNKNVSADSLLTYKYRVVRVIGDYEKYGVDPTKMSTWTKKTVVRQKKSESSSLAETKQENVKKTEVDTSGNFIFDFSGGIKLIIPRNQKTSDAIADGELKVIRQSLAKFAGDFMTEPPASNDLEKDSKI